MVPTTDAAATGATGAGVSPVDPDDSTGDRSPLTDAEVESFAALGLDPVALLVYQRTLLVDDWSIASLREQLEVGEDAVTPAISSLVAKGLLVPSQEVTGTMRPVSPRVGLTRLIEERARTLRLAQERLSQTRQATQQLIEIVDDHDTRQRSTLEQVEGRDDVADRISELLVQATSEVLTVLTMLPTPEAMESARRGDVALLERGVQTRMLVLAGHLRRSREYVAYLTGLVALGANVRVTTTLPTRLILIDDSAAIMPTDPDNPGAGATIVRHQSLIRLMRDNFESLWRDGRPLGSNECRPDRWEPNELELEVIRFLGQGNKDEAIARRVGMSLRSVRRLVSQVSHELGSNSRFELGVICRDRGWVEATERG